MKKCVKQVGIRMDADMIRKIESLAKTEGRTVSNMIRRLLHRKLEDMKYY